MWAIIPFYNSYITWKDKDKQKVIQKCELENNATLCRCLEDSIFKEYRYSEYKKIDYLKEKDYLEFIKDAKEECLDDSWF